MDRKTDNAKKGATMGKLSHGGYRLKQALERGKIDGRSEVGQAVKRRKSDLEASLGGKEHLSAQEMILLERVVVKIIVLENVEFWALQQSTLLTPDGHLPGVLSRNYLSWSAELRRDLQTLGMKRRSREIGLQDLLRAAVDDDENQEGGETSWNGR